jgi:hypothetical protein
MIFIIEAARRRRHSANTHNARASAGEKKKRILSFTSLSLYIYSLLSFHALCGPGDYVTLRPKWSAKNALLQKKELGAHAMNNLPAATMITSSQRKKPKQRDKSKFLYLKSAAK